MFQFKQCQHFCRNANSFFRIVPKHFQTHHYHHHHHHHHHIHIIFKPTPSSISSSNETTFTLWLLSPADHQLAVRFLSDPPIIQNICPDIKQNKQTTSGPSWAGHVTNTGCRSTPQLLIWRLDPRWVLDPHLPSFTLLPSQSPSLPPTPSFSSLSKNHLEWIKAHLALQTVRNSHALQLNIETILGASSLCHYD